MISCSGAPFGPVVALAAVALVLVLLELHLDHCLGLVGEDIDLQLDRLAPDILPTSLSILFSDTQNALGLAFWSFRESKKWPCTTYSERICDSGSLLLRSS